MSEQDFVFPFQRPELPPPESWVGLLGSAYATHRFSNDGPLVRQLEMVLSQRIGRPVVMAANGTAAITAALMALDRTGAVILPSFTFPATLNAVLQAGLTPVLADVSLSTWELDVPSIEEAAKKSNLPIAAVLGVRTFGLCRDWSEQRAWCEQRGIPLILDSAAALGGMLRRGEPAGRQGYMETFSLHATKVFAVGEGGAIACDPDQVLPLKRAMNFGLQIGRLYGNGFNGKMSELTAVIGIAQEQIFDTHLRERRGAASIYAKWMKEDMPAWLEASNPGDPPWQAWPMLAPTVAEADRFEREAAKCQVQTRRYYRPALHSCEIFRSYAWGRSLPNASALADRIICLPMYSKWAEGELVDLVSRLQAAARALNL